MKTFNALFATLTAGLLATALTLTAASFVSPPEPASTSLVAAANAPAAHNG